VGGIRTGTIGLTMISQTVEYALRAVVLLANSVPAARTTAEIAEATQIPPAYLVKVLQSLTRAGILSSRRGAGGGVALTRAPDVLTVLDVVNAIEPVARITTCPLGIKDHGMRLCALHARLDEAMAATEDAFRQTTMAELLADSNPSSPLCGRARAP
jgi:Rrf2 family nitric oxide-sensitive transcriptional repressor